MESNEYTATNLVESVQVKTPTWSMVCGEQLLAEIGYHPLVLASFDGLIGNIQKSELPITLIQAIEQDTDGYPSAAEFFIAKLTDKLIQQFRRYPTVIHRTMDFKTDDLSLLRGFEFFEAKEAAPDFGMRGMRRYISAEYDFPLCWEFEACCRAAKEDKPLGIVFPFVSLPEELSWGLDKLPVKDLVAAGMMVEISSNILQADDFAETLLNWARPHGLRPLFVIGLGDLTQNLLGASRKDPLMAQFFYKPADPLVTQSITHALTVARQFNIDVGMYASALKEVGQKDIYAALTFANLLSFVLE